MGRKRGPAADHNLAKYLVTQLRHSHDLAVHMMRPTGWVTFEKLLELVPNLDRERASKVMSGARFTWKHVGVPGAGNDAAQSVAATHGHSIPGVYGPGRLADPSEVPEELSHGTRDEHCKSIMLNGLMGVRRPVHLRPSDLAAWKEYSHRVRVRARQAAEVGRVRIWKCEYNDVWLAIDNVGLEYIAGVEEWSGDPYVPVNVEFEGPARVGSMVAPTPSSAPALPALSGLEVFSDEHSDDSESPRARSVYSSCPSAVTTATDMDKVLALEVDLCPGREMDVEAELSDYLAGTDSELEDPMRQDEPNVVEMAQVVQWRQDTGLVRDSDFAFAFCSDAEASVHSHAMLLAWRAVRHCEMQSVGTSAASILEQASSSSSSVPPRVPQPSAARKRGPTEAQLRAREKGADEDLEAKRVAASTLIDWVRVLPQHPWLVAAAGAKFTETEFEAFLSRRADTLLKFELRCLRSALLALQRLHGHRTSGIQSAWMNGLVVEEYLSTLAKPNATHVALRWCERNLLMRFELDMVKVQSTSSGTVGCAAKQAVACEPAMLCSIGATCKRLQREGDRRWMSSVIGHVMQSGVMRRRHLQRSRLLRLSTTTAYFWCAKGKTGGRQGFPWSCPADTMDGVPIMKMWLDAKQLTEDVTGKDIGWLCFDVTNGEPLAMSAITAAWRSVFSATVSNAELLTSYSFRRVATTLASALHLPWELRLALGAWQGDVSASSARTGGVSLMPARYADNRCDVQAITKLACQMVMQDLQSKGCSTWSSSLAPLAAMDLKQILAAASQAYQESTWVVQLETAEVRRFQLLEASDSESLTADDDAVVEAKKEPLLPAALPLVHWSVAAGAHAVTHFHYAPWDPDDPGATPLCRMRQSHARPLRKPIIVGSGWESAKNGGPMCTDCARSVGISLEQETPELAVLPVKEHPLKGKFIKEISV